MDVEGVSPKSIVTRVEPGREAIRLCQSSWLWPHGALPVGWTLSSYVLSPSYLDDVWTMPKTCAWPTGHLGARGNINALFIHAQPYVSPGKAAQWHPLEQSGMSLRYVCFNLGCITT